MFGEEASGPVDEELVELGPKPFCGEAKTSGDHVHDLRERVRPRAPVQTDIRGVDLPAVADRRVLNGLGSLPVRRALRGRDQRLDLRLRHRERQLPGALHGDARHGGEDAGADAIVTGTVDGPEKLIDAPVFRDGFGSVHGLGALIEREAGDNDDQTDQSMDVLRGWQPRWGRLSPCEPGSVSTRSSRAWPAGTLHPT